MESDSPPVFSMTKFLVTVPVAMSVVPKSVLLVSAIAVLPEAMLFPLPLTLISLSDAVPDTLKVYVPSSASLLDSEMVAVLVPAAVGLNTTVNVPEAPGAIVEGE